MIPSHVRIVATGPTGRASRSSGITTVGPDTTRMAPSSTETRTDSWNSRWTAPVVSAHVMTTPTVTKAMTGRRAAAPSSLKRSSNPPTNRRMPTASDTTGNSAGPRIRSGSTMSRIGPTSRPPARSRMIEGNLRRRASHCSPTPSTMMTPIPNRTSVFTESQRYRGPRDRAGPAASTVRASTAQPGRVRRIRKGMDR